MSRRRYLVLSVCLIVAGLLLRLPRWGLPLSVHHLGGGLLWGGMLQSIVTALRPRAWGVTRAALLAFSLATAIELTRLFHGPALDAFRATLAGELLVGRIFSLSNILTYAVGIAIVTAATWPRHGGLAAAPRI